MNKKWKYTHNWIKYTQNAFKKAKRKAKNVYFGILEKVVQIAQWTPKMKPIDKKSAKSFKNIQKRGWLFVKDRL